MRIFGIGPEAGAAAGAPRVMTAPSEHPSAPIPVQGPGVGSGIRADLGDSGLRIFPVMLGGAEFGWNVDTANSHAILDTYIQYGGNAVHTADSFSGGRSEHIIGQWMHSRGVRDDIVLATRVGRHPDHPGLGPVNLVRAVEASLTRLRTDRIDVLYLDGSAGAGSLEDTLATAEWLIDAGKVRTVGAFAFRAEQLVEARILSSAGVPRITVLDVPYNLMRRGEFEGDLRLVTGAQGIVLTPSHPLEHGFLAGVYRSREKTLKSVRASQIAGSFTKRGGRVLRALDTIGAELGVPDAAVAVAWLLAQRVVAAPIVNAFAPQHVEELVQGVGLRLTRAQLAEIARASE